MFNKNLVKNVILTFFKMIIRQFSNTMGYHRKAFLNSFKINYVKTEIGLINTLFEFPNPEIVL